MNGPSDTIGFLSPASFCVPEHMAPSGWIEYGPFAFWLVDAMKPRLYVELGVGGGFSYFCFCQAIDRSGLATKAFGIDRWAEDDRSVEIIAKTNARYSAFSTLKRMSFDAAVTVFAPGSIDLLHIDGDGSYDGAAAILSDWRTLLADDAIVLLHGVEKLYEELRLQHMSFRFSQGAGLGIVAVGGTVPEPLRRLLTSAEPASGNWTLDAYTTLGQALRTRRDLIANREGLQRLLSSSDDAAEVVRLRSVAQASALRPTLAATAPLGVSSPAVPNRRSAAPDAKSIGVTPGETEGLRAKLREARANETAARRRAEAMRGIFQTRHSELRRQTRELDDAAASARAEVIRLAADAFKLVEAEDEANQALTQAQARVDELLRHEQYLLRPRRDLKHILTFGVARRLGRQARTYATLVARMDLAAAGVREARRAYESARAMRHKGEQLAVAAEPQASELASAAVVLHGEFASVEAILSMLPPESAGSNSSQADVYARWVDLYDTITDADRRGIGARLLRLDYKPIISVVMPVYAPRAEFLKQAVASVQAQLYTHWELCIADDASPDPAIVACLRELAAADPRIRLVERASNGHISAASNTALRLASGEFVALLDHDDVLPEQALFEIVACLNEHRDLDLIYSDEDHIDEYGIRSNPYFKSGYNRDLMLGHNLVNHLGVYRRALVEKVGGFRLGFEGSQDYDLALRVIDASSPERIRHIPSILYHWRSISEAPTFSEAFMQRCIDAAQRALADHFRRRGEKARVATHPIIPVWQRVVRTLPDPAPLVTIIIPTKDKAEILGPCIDGILNRTSYPNYEILIVDHQSTDPLATELLAELAKEPRVTILPYEGPFNYSAMNNAAAVRARGSVLALLNNDIEVINSDWLDEMVAVAALPDVGAVGAKLLYPDNRVQHAGVVLGPGGVAGHLFHLLDAQDPGYFGRAVMTSTVAAVTGACLVVRKLVFEEVGGFDEENLAVAFNDIDICLKITERGYRNVFTPQAMLYHHESASRGDDQTGERLKRFNRETEFMIQKWDTVLIEDPFYNPNLDLATGDFSLSFPPRRRKPWRAGMDLGEVITESGERS